MGDRWYTQMKQSGNDKKPRVLKADVAKEINVLLGVDLTGLTKMTMVEMQDLLTAVRNNVEAKSS